MEHMTSMANYYPSSSIWTHDILWLISMGIGVVNDLSYLHFVLEKEGFNAMNIINQNI
jgi:hypothetical protein